MKLIKKTFYVYLCVFVFLLIFNAWTKYAELNFSISFIFYWMFLVAWIWAILIWKLTSHFSMSVAFALTIFGIVIFAIGLADIAEVILRLGFVGWIVGTIQAIVEYKKNAKT